MDCIGDKPKNAAAVGAFKARTKNMDSVEIGQFIKNSVIDCLRKEIN